MKKLVLVATHVAMLVLGFVLGIYLLPILIAPEGPSLAQISAQMQDATYKAVFRRDLRGSDALHWGEGIVYIGKQSIGFTGKLAPGPDYKLYLSPQFVETGEEFKRLKSSMVRVGDVRSFENFLIPLPAGVDPSNYNTVIVWCEAFGQFISAAQYK